VNMPTVVERLIQQASAQGLGPLCDPACSASRFGFRPGRSAHQAVKQIQSDSKRGYKGAVARDLAQCFDRVTHDALMARVARTVRDKALLRLLGKDLRAGGLVGARLQPTAAGVPQGSPLSPLWSTVRLDDLDKERERCGPHVARSGEDLLLVGKRPRAGDRVTASLTRSLRHHCKLESNEPKRTGGPTHTDRVLGLTCHGTRIHWSPAASQDLRHRWRQLTGRSWGVSLAHRIAKLTEYLRGWRHYFGLSQSSRPLPELEAWLRRRRRRCVWQQGRYGRTKVRELLKLGTAKKPASLTALSRKGPWPLSPTLATQTGLTHPWLSDTRGLVSLRALWISLHSPT
jgi:RNA-directed DNA polymerase